MGFYLVKHVWGSNMYTYLVKYIATCGNFRTLAPNKKNELLCQNLVTLRLCQVFKPR